MLRKSQFNVRSNKWQTILKSRFINSHLNYDTVRLRRQTLGSNVGQSMENKQYSPSHTWVAIEKHQRSLCDERFSVHFVDSCGWNLFYQDTIYTSSYKRQKSFKIHVRNTAQTENLFYFHDYGWLYNLISDNEMKNLLLCAKMFLIICKQCIRVTDSFSLCRPSNFRSLHLIFVNPTFQLKLGTQIAFGIVVNMKLISEMQSHSFPKENANNISINGTDFVWCAHNV